MPLRLLFESDGKVLCMFCQGLIFKNRQKSDIDKYFVENSNSSVDRNCLSINNSNFYT